MPSRNTLRIPTLAGSVLLSAFAATPMLGQTPPQKPVAVPAIEVVATRPPEATHDIPASIDVIPRQHLRVRGVTSVVDALSLAAGIAVAPGGDAGPASAVPEIWGLREFDAFLLVVDGI